MSIDWTSVVVALLASIPGIMALLKGRKKEQADAASTLVESSLKIVDQLEENVESLQKDVNALKITVGIYKRNQKKLIDGIEMLIKQIEALGRIPVWTIEQANLESEKENINLER